MLHTAPEPKPMCDDEDLRLAYEDLEEAVLAYEAATADQITAKQQVEKAEKRLHEMWAARTKNTKTEDTTIG